MKTVIACIFFLCFSCLVELNAQNAFEEFGYKGRVLTMTNGRFNETHDTDSVVQIGSILFDVNKKKIVGDAPVDTVTYLPNPTLISRWWSVDPLAEKYPALTPYNFVGNNPINLVDPDGRDVDVTFSGTDKQKNDARRMLTMLLNKGLGGQFEITLTATKNKNVFKLGITDAKSLGKDKDGNQIKGDVNKLGESGKTFYNKLSGMINDKQNTAQIDLSVRNRDVTTGYFGDWQKIDMSDVAAWPSFDPHADSQESGATDIGKFMHETGENFNRKGGYNSAHRIAIMQYENAVNGTRRGSESVPRRGVVLQSFLLKNGTSVELEITNGSNGVIVVTPVTKDK